MMYWYGDHHPGAGWWLLMSLGTVLFWAAVILAGYALVRAAAERGRSHSDARRLLDERLARGEIDADDYTRRRAMLDRSEHPS